MAHKRTCSLSCVALIAPVLVACASGGVTTGEEIQLEMNLPEYTGPKATIAVGTCDDRSGGAANLKIGEGDGAIAYSFTSEVGDGMADMFITGLLNTDRFRVLESRDIGALEREQEFHGEGAQGQMVGADLLVTCAVTSVEANAGGLAGGLIGAVGSVVGIGGGGLKKSTVVLDIRLVDARTREILTAFSADGTATDAAVVGGVLGGSAGGGLGAYSNTPIEGAVKKAILKASEHLALNTPERYFGKPTTGETPRSGDGVSGVDAVDDGEEDLASQEQQQQESGSPQGDE